MAIGDVQNRFDIGRQINQTGEVANQNRQQTNPAKNQENNPANQTAQNAANVTVQTQNITPQQVNQPTNPAQNTVPPQQVNQTVNPAQNTGGDNANVVENGGAVPQTQNVWTQNIGQIEMWEREPIRTKIHYWKLIGRIPRQEQRPHRRLK